MIKNRFREINWRTLLRISILTGPYTKVITEIYVTWLVDYVKSYVNPAMAKIVTKQRLL